MVITPIVFWASFEPCEKAIHAAERTWARPKTRVTVAGNAWAKKFSSKTMTTNAAVKPRRGENIRPWNVFSSPPNWIALQPALATPAPTMLKISAWLELDGMPKYQVTRFQVIAAINAEMTSACVDSSGETIPLPTVVATAVPDNAPTKFSTPAMSTARPGDRTRVATTVAIALAVSWKPLMKSKTRPRIKIARSSKRSTLGVSSGILQRDVAEDRGHGLGLVGGVLEQLVQVLPAHRVDQLGDFGNAVVERRQCLREQVVGLVFEPMDLL